MWTFSVSFHDENIPRPFGPGYPAGLRPYGLCPRRGQNHHIFIGSVQGHIINRFTTVVPWRIEQGSCFGNWWFPALPDDSRLTPDCLFSPSSRPKGRKHYRRTAVRCSVKTAFSPAPGIPPHPSKTWSQGLPVPRVVSVIDMSPPTPPAPPCLRLA